jgi:hypothetical protein
MIKSPVLLAVILLLSTLGAVGFQVFELNRLRLENMNASAEPLQTQQEENTNAKKLPSLAALAPLNLMGNASRPVEKTVVENLVPISALKLILVGTIVKNKMDESSALIQRSNRETRRYFVGDVIEGGVSLVSVAVDQVILKREDASEVLRYPQGGALASVPPEAASSLPAAVSFPQSAAIAQAQLNNAAATTPPTVQPNVQPITGSRRMIKLRERLKMPTAPVVPNPQAAPVTDEPQGTN